MSTNPHVHAVFGELFDRMFPPITPPDPPAADEAEHGVCALPELTAEQMAEGHITEERR